MVRIQQGKLVRSLTPNFIQWLKKSEASEDEQFRVLKESELTLLDAIGALVSPQKTLTYLLSDNTQVRISAEEDEDFSLEFIAQNESETNIVELYEQYFPTPSGGEAHMAYHERLLSGLDSFVDALAVGKVVEITEKNL